MGQIINEIGNRYGSLVVISKSDINKSRHTYWNCQCDCGKMTVVSGSNLRTGKVKSCGCTKGKSRIEDLTNQQFGDLTVLYRDTNTNDQRIRWMCKCSCGNLHSVRANHLKLGTITNCGCKITKSKGEEKIRQLLLSNNISFISQKYINYNNHKYYFDFMVDNKYFIEYDGI